MTRDKWGRKDWYEYGVSWRVGWLNSSKIDEIKEATNYTQGKQHGL